MGKPGFPIPLLRGPMFTSAVHAAPPRTDGMKIISWEGCALPNPPRGRGLGARASGPRPLRYGETRFPHAPGAYFHVRSQAVASQWVWPPRAGRGVWGEAAPPHTPPPRTSYHVIHFTDFGIIPTRATPDKARWNAKRPARRRGGTDWRRRRESNPRMAVLQTAALPLCYVAESQPYSSTAPPAPQLLATVHTRGNPRAWERGRAARAPRLPSLRNSSAMPGWPWGSSPRLRNAKPACAG